MSTVRRRQTSTGRRRRTTFKTFCWASGAIVFFYNLLLWFHFGALYKGISLSPTRTPDAYFNNLPLFLREFNDERIHPKERVGVYDPSFHSTVHCVGETHNEKTSWKHRSCNYVHLCLNVADPDNKTPDFFVVSSRFDQDFSSQFRSPGSSFYSSSNLGSSDVALGAIMPEWGHRPDDRMPYKHGIDHVRWSPKVYDSIPSRYYYELEDNVVMIPFHAVGADNVGHLLWDNLLPIYNLLRMFGLDRNLASHNSNQEGAAGRNIINYKHLLIRVDTMTKLFATCDLRPKKQEACQRAFNRFLPLFGVDPETFTPLTMARLTKYKSTKDASPSPPKPPNYPICSKHAVAGMGWLGDHGTSIGDHGWWMDNEKYTSDLAFARNLGRGPELYAFRNFMLQNMGLDPYPYENSDRSHPMNFRILLSCHSSEYLDRNFGMEEQYKALADAFPGTDIAKVTLKELSLEKQLELLSQPVRPPNEHIIFVSANGGGTATAFFLPRGSSMILYYNERGGRYANSTNSGGPAMLDWDLMNNMGYVRTHWLKIGTMNDPDGLDALVRLVRHEMDSALNGMLLS